MTHPKTIDEFGLVQSAVCWLDLLGIRDQLEKAGKAGREAEFVEKYRSVLGSAYESLQERLEDSAYRWTAFGDTIILSVPLKVAHPETTLGFFCSDAAEVQFELARSGFFSRGGIAIGPLYASDKLTVGTGMLSALRLESSDAVMPRVIVDSVTRDLLKSFVGYYANHEDSPQANYCVIDQDDQVLINYLYAPLGLECPQPEFLDQLGEHAAQVNEHLAKHTMLGKIRAKYQWLAGYHNWFCDNWLAPSDAALLRIEGTQSGIFRRLVA